MSTDSLLRSTLHPPCPEEQEILEVTVPTDRKQLALADRVSLRLGLWLLLRAQRPRRTAHTPSREELMLLHETRRIAQRESLAMVTFDMQRYLL